MWMHVYSRYHIHTHLCIQTIVSITPISSYPELYAICFYESDIITLSLSLSHTHSLTHFCFVCIDVRVCECDSVSIHASTQAQVQGLYVCKHNILLNTSCFSYFHSSPFTFNGRSFLTSVTLCNFVQNKSI